MTDVPMVKSIIINDLHIPFHDKPVTNLVLDFIRQERPDQVLLNGDVVDCYTVSSFNKNPLTQAGLKREIREAGEIMEYLSCINSKLWIGGNHEDRLRRYIWGKAPELAELDELSFAQLFHLDRYGFKWLEYGDIHQIGKLSVTHGNLARKHSGETARAHFDTFGRSVLVGHTHRLGAYYKTRLGKPYVAFENGCLCGLNPEYVKHPDWQHGFAIVHHDDATGQFAAQQIPVFKVKGEPRFYYGKELVG